MQSLDLNVSNNLLKTPTSLPFPSTFAAMDNVGNNPGSTTPPDFDFNIPCRYFKSSFARSLSLNNPSNHFQCKSLDYDINNLRSYNNINTNNNSNNGIGNSFNNCRNDGVKNIDAPPLPQRMNRAATPPTATTPTTQQITTTTAMSISGNINISINAKNEVSSSDESCSSKLPPALPARRSMPVTNANNNNNINNNNNNCNNMNSSNGNASELQPQHKQQQLPLLTQLRQQQPNHNNNNSNNNNHSNGIANAIGIGNSYANDSGCGSGSISINSNAKSANSGGNVGSVIHGNFNKLTINHTLQQQQQQHQRQEKMLNIDHNIRRNVWPKDNVEQDFNCYDDTQHETTKMSSKANYPTVTVAVEHKKPTLPPPLTQPTSFEVHENAMNIEAVLLQNQVDTLQWQLKQVETSCEMYRAVMEEVVRFLDRYHNHKQNNRNNTEQISRSKSLYHVYAGGHENNPHSDEAMATSYLRTRSSTNLIDLKQSPHLLTPPASTHKDAVTVVNGKYNKLSEPNYDTVTPTNSYSTFKDFTWRRSPKQKPSDCRTHTPAAADDVEEKLNQEAFRLSRTIHNLLNTSTQQPVLTQHRNSLSALNLARLNVKTPNGSTLTLHAPTMHNSTSLTLAPHTADIAEADTLVSTTVSTIVSPPKTATLANAEMLFLRSANIRDSRLSLHSTTDSSVHSTTSSSCTASSSSKVETDDEHTLPYITGALLCNNNNNNKNIKQTSPLGSTTEDESGFSSISSFQEIGLPMCSTPCKKYTTSRGNQHGVTTSEQQSSQDQNMDSPNHTLTSTTTPTVPTLTTNAKHPNNIVGVPINSLNGMSNRWELPTKAYRNTNKRFSTLSNDDSTAVLWV